MEVAFDVLVTRACTLDTEAQVIVAGPAVHLGIGNLGTELHGDGRTVAERLVGVGTGGSGKKPRAVRKPEPFPMPLVDVLGEGSERLGCRGGEDRVVANLGQVLGMETHLGTQVIGEHLRAQADAEKWFLLLECDADPVSFPADELIRVVGAHGAAKNDGTAVVCKRRGERMAAAGLAHIECVSAAAKPVADVPRLGPLLV